MPAITLGLVEVEERLRTLRHRLNGYTVLQAVSISLSVVLSTISVLMWCGYPLLTFSGTTVGLLLLSAAATLASVLYVRQRWLDLDGTAHLADQRGQLTDRLTTLVDLRARPRASRLTPILIAQTLALGERWGVQRIMPRRFPRSVFMLLASLLVFGATPLLAPEPPVADAAARLASDAAGLPGETVSIRAGELGHGGSGGVAVEGMGAPQMLPNAGSTTEGAGARAAHPATSAPRGDSLTEALPEPLRHALQSALKGINPDWRDTAREPEGPPHEEGERGNEAGRSNKADGRSAHPALLANEEPQGSNGERGAPQPNRSQTDADLLRHDQSSNPDPHFEGSSPAAGTGSSPNGPFGDQPADLVVDPSAPRTFKLTITSFLHAVAPKGTKPNPHSITGDAAVTGGAPGTLNERQLTDDVLRKAEIPPEYEDIVRRVYSLRADQ